MVNYGVSVVFHSSKGLWPFSTVNPTTVFRLFYHFQQNSRRPLDCKEGPFNRKIQWENATCTVCLTIKYRHKTECLNAIATKLLTNSYPAKSNQLRYMQNLANLLSRIDALLHGWVQIATNLVQRNLSPRLLCNYTIINSTASVKEKTPHQNIGEALNFTFCASWPGIGGRTTPGLDRI